jgi:DNA-directed RNA polymerase II subunit RPB1
VQNNYRKDGLKIYERINNTELKPERIYRIFERISDEDCQFLGFDPIFARPEWMIIKNLLVCPPSSRPSVSVD